MNKFKRYVINILLGIDQLGNTLIGGSPDETISSRLGRIKIENGGKIPYYRPFSKITDWALDKIDKNHSLDAVEKDINKENYDGVFDKPKK